MTIYHEYLVGEQVHEPKGASGASSGTHYFSDGAAGGSWTNIVGTASDSIGANVTEVEFTGLSDYSQIVLEIHDLSVDLSGSERLDLLVGDSGGYKTSSGYYYYTSRYQSTEVAPAGDTKFELLKTVLTTGTYYYNAHVFINNFNEDRYSTIEVIGAYSSNALISANTYQCWTFGYTTTAEDYDRLKLVARNGGSVINGSAVRLFGWKG